MTKEQFIKKHFPRFIVAFLMFLRHWFYIFKGFDHKLAQKGELMFHKTIRSSEEMSRKFLMIDMWKESSKSEPTHPFYDFPKISYFLPDAESYQEFCREMQQKSCLEIGSGSIGVIARMPWIKERIIIEPLLNPLRQHQMSTFGRTLFTEDIQCHSQEAEAFIPSYENSITGFIICDNVLDHCRDPWLVLENIARYAHEGCMLLLWSDIWHWKGLNKEHGNIAKDVGAFQQKIEELNFRIKKVLPSKTKQDLTTEYGCIAVKLPSNRKI